MEVRREIRDFIERRLREEGGDADELYTQERILLTVIRGGYSPDVMSRMTPTHTEKLYRDCVPDRG